MAHIKSFLIDEKLEDSIRFAAYKNCCSQSEVIRCAIANYLKENGRNNQAAG
jgi:hypothetical protein